MEEDSGDEKGEEGAIITKNVPETYGYPGNRMLTSMFYAEVASEPEEDYEEPYYVMSRDFEEDPWEKDFWETPMLEDYENVWDNEGEGDEVAKWVAEKKRKLLMKTTKASRRWTELEEKKFEEALDLYGRNWQSCATYIGTKDAGHVRSHAQKYFIRLFMEGKPVPKKCAETGEGHTLSGKELDPNSGAAKGYFAKCKQKQAWKKPQPPRDEDGDRVKIDGNTQLSMSKTANYENKKEKIETPIKMEATAASPKRLVIKVGGKRVSPGNGDESEGDSSRSKSSTEKSLQPKKLLIKFGGKKRELSHTSEESAGHKGSGLEERVVGTTVQDESKELSKDERKEKKKTDKEKEQLCTKSEIEEKEKRKVKKVKFKLS